MSIFEAATRKKLRFKAVNGVISTEDLWDLKLEALDAIAKALHKKLQDQEVSFITTKTDSEAKVQLEFDVVKHVIDTKIAEAEANKAAAEVTARRRELQEALHNRRQQTLQGMTEAELQAELAKLAQ